MEYLVSCGIVETKTSSDPLVSSKGLLIFVVFSSAIFTKKVSVFPLFAVVFPVFNFETSKFTSVLGRLLPLDRVPALVFVSARGDVDGLAGTKAVASLHSSANSFAP